MAGRLCARVLRSCARTRALKADWSARPLSTPTGLKLAGSWLRPHEPRACACLQRASRHRPNVPRLAFHRAARPGGRPE
eukprot:365249-Chlamydomonas_euryale.AAC.9